MTAQVMWPSALNKHVPTNQWPVKIMHSTMNSSLEAAFIQLQCNMGTIRGSHIFLHYRGHTVWIPVCIDYFVTKKSYPPLSHHWHLSHFSLEHFCQALYQIVLAAWRQRLLQHWLVVYSVFCYALCRHGGRLWLFGYRCKVPFILHILPSPSTSLK